jgi:HSP20 family protein
MATSMQRRTTPSTFGLFPLLTRDIDLLQSNMRRLFQGGGPSTRGDLEVDLPQALAWVPPVEIRETSDELMISAEIPGAAADEVHVTIDGDTLTIRGEKRDQRREGDENTQYYLVERSYGSFQRSFTLPSTVDPDSIEADFNNGVLNIRLRKLSSARPRGREIPISSSSDGGAQSRVGSGTAQGRGASGESQGSGERMAAQSAGGDASGTQSRSAGSTSGGGGAQAQSSGSETRGSRGSSSGRGANG